MPTKVKIVLKSKESAIEELCCSIFSPSCLQVWYDKYFQLIRYDAHFDKPMFPFYTTNPITVIEDFKAGKILTIVLNRSFTVIRWRVVRFQPSPDNKYVKRNQLTRCCCNKRTDACNSLKQWQVLSALQYFQFSWIFSRKKCDHVVIGLKPCKLPLSSSWLNYKQQLCYSLFT